MRTIKLWVDTGYYGADYEEVIEVEDDCAEEDLEEMARELMFENIEYGWTEIDETEIDDWQTQYGKLRTDSRTYRTL